MNRVPLNYWIHQVLAQSQARVKVRLRGNNLHVLCEGNPCPAVDRVTQLLRQAIAKQPLESLLPPDTPSIHRLIVYGRVTGESQPSWTRSLTFPTPASSALQPAAETAATHPAAEAIATEAIAPAPGPEAATTASALANPAPAAAPEAMQPPAEALPLTHAPAPPETTAPEQPPETPSLQELAQQGEPAAIAHYLSYAFSPQGIAVRVKVDSPLPDTSFFANRLLVLCESAYVPDAALLAEPIAQKLRELELTQYRDAIVFGQVCGESRPEWVSRVDLTPPDEILREWARWGDVQAIARLLNRAIATHQVELSALLKDATLHVSCAQIGGGVPDKLMAIAAVTPVLQSLSAQGIQAATIYGVSHLTGDSALPDVAPAWVYWLDLPAGSQTDLATSTLDMARQGDLSALTFLLARLLNPDLDTKLATGGIRVQLRQKGDLLHIMTDAPNCPQQAVVAPAIARLLKPLNLSGVQGVRIYGRRAGQRQPLWTQGVDFVSRSLTGPEVMPEFAASAAHVDELLSPPGAIVPWNETADQELPTALAELYGKVLGRVQRSLLHTQLFVPVDSPILATGAGRDTANTPIMAGQHNWKIATLWATVGILFVVQIDWFLGAWVRLQQQATAQTTAIAPDQPAPTAPAPAPLPDNLLNKPRIKQWDTPDASAFTQPGQRTLETSPNAANPEADANPLPASTLQAKAETVLAPDLDFPTFNSRQLDRQIALYRQYLELNGPPDVLIIGSSRALRGVDPAALESALADQGYAGMQVFNLGVNGATAQVVDLLVRQVLPQDKLPKLIVFADGSRAFNSGRQDLTYNGIATSPGYQALLAGKPPIPSTVVAQTPEATPDLRDGKATSVTEENHGGVAQYHKQIDQALNQRLAGLSALYQQRDRLKTHLRDQVIAWLPEQFNAAGEVIASSEDLLNASSPSAAASPGTGLAADGQGMVDIDGFLPLSVRFNPATYYQKYARVSGDYDSDYDAFSLDGAQTEALTNLARYAHLHQIPVVFVNLPLTQEYLDPARQRHETAFQQKMLAIAPPLNLLYRDLSGALKAQPQYFSDPSHLNRYGAYEVARRLAQDVMIPWQLAR